MQSVQFWFICVSFERLFGSTSLTLNSSGSKIAELRYKACPLRFAAGVLREGETRYSSGTTYTAFQFTGQRNETALGLYFYNARWYDPALSRFTSADTIVPTQTQGTQAWDRYAFVNNNPVRYIDPMGNKACDETDANGNCYTEDDITKGKKEAASNQGCSNPTYCENGTPKSPSGNLEDFAQGGDATTKEPELISPADCAIIGSYCVGFKDWDEIDKISLTVDILGLVGDVALATMTPVGVIVWLASEIGELITAGSAWDQLEMSGDPTSVVLLVTGGVAKGLRLAPEYGAIANIVSIGTNVLSFTPLP